ncbi:MAG: phenylalanine--tRNA ligase subunit alpha [Candidatus Pacearchaeota archaeon]|nr:phenylalanine--tRNA ligase subunit alpha [Candidatus Pacearchaeota archaeon]
MEKETEIQRIIETLSPLETKIIPFLKEDIEKIKEKSGLDEVSLLRALKFLENKGIIKIKTAKKTIIDLGTNGIYYKKNYLPERKLLLTLEEKNHISLDEAKKLSKLSDNEFKVSIGVLKDKALIELTNNKLTLKATKEEIIKKMPEESLLEILPIEKEKLKDEMLLAFENLKKRKDIIETKEKNIFDFELTDLGKEIAGKEIKLDLLEEVTPEMIKEGVKGKKFRKYDLSYPVPQINGGKRHFVNQSIEYAKKIWTDLGFKEMSGPLIDSSFWIFDALFTPQDHPAREMQDTFFIKNILAKLPEKKLVNAVKQSHEKGIEKSKGWNYEWKEKEAQKVVLRTHTTGLSARTLSKLKEENLPAKYFAIGKVFRNETVDWSHGFEFYQTEGIVIDKNATFRNLLGYLKEFYEKMGYKKIKFVPSFFPYTEPSVEIQIFHPDKKIWLELGGAGIFRPELTTPLLGKPIPVLAWGQGFDRIITEFYKIKDLREMYANDIKELRNKKIWIK